MDTPLVLDEVIWHTLMCTSLCTSIKCISSWGTQGTLNTEMRCLAIFPGNIHVVKGVNKHPIGRRRSDLACPRMYITLPKHQVHLMLGKTGFMEHRNIMSCIGL